MSARELVTGSAAFGYIPIINNELFAVREGIPVEYAVTTAACLAESIERMTTQGVQDGIDPEVSYLLAFAARAIQGLMGSVELAMPEAKV